MPRPTYPRSMTRDPIATAPRGFRLSERTTPVPAHAREAVAALVSSWEFKRRAGFETPAAAPAPGVEGVLAKRLFGIRFAEPVRVVWADASGFGYETRPGHPILGEESFRLGEDGVFVARSVSRPASALWWMLSPGLLFVQWATHRQYVRIVQDCVRRQGASQNP